MDGPARRRSAPRRSLQCEHLEARELLSTAGAAAPSGFRALRSEQSAYPQSLSQDVRQAAKTPEFRQQNRELDIISRQFSADLRPVRARSHATEREAAALNRDERQVVQPSAQIHSILAAQEPLKAGQSLDMILQSMESALFYAELTGVFTDQQWANSLEQKFLRQDLAALGASPATADRFLTDVRKFAVSINASPSERTALVMDADHFLDVAQAVSESTGLEVMDPPPVTVGGNLRLFIHHRP